MAVDTRDKRASVLGLGLAAILALPAPDASINQGDRQHVAYSYRGLTSSPPVPADGDLITVDAEDRTITVDAEDRSIVVPQRPAP